MNGTSYFLPDGLASSIAGLPSFQRLSSTFQQPPAFVSWSSLWLVVGIYALYALGLAVYRLTLHPLASVPGPKLAAMTMWYETYFDVWLGGQMIHQTAKMHKQYGPLVRINPWEVHCNDPAFIDTIFPGPSRKTDKFIFTGMRTLTPNSMVATIDHDLHRKRRSTVASFFSTASIRRLEPIMRKSITKLLNRMQGAAASGEIMPMNYVFKACTSDVITEYAFGKSTDFLDLKDYAMAYMLSVDVLFLLNHAFLHFPWLGKMVESMPPWIAKYINPGMYEMHLMKEAWIQQVEDIRNSPDPEAGKNTIFHGVLNSKLPPEEKTSARLGHEAQLIVLAGQDTTASTLSSTVYELLANPSILLKLKQELSEAIPNADEIPTLSQVEQLPWLNAIIQEILRLHPGVVSRLPRVSPDVAVVYPDKKTGREYIIPAGTSMNMTTKTLHMNDEVFEDPESFQPERWIENPRLDKNLIAFARGTRNCLGMSLARQELVLILSSIFRKYDLYNGSNAQAVPTLELIDTIRPRDVDMNADMIIPYPAKGSHGVKVKVRHPKV